MSYWVELGIIVLVVGGMVQGYLGGLRKTAVLALFLLLCFLLALAFGQAGADYLVLYHDADIKIMPVLLERLPLVITVSPPRAPLPDAGQRAASIVQHMPLTPVYKDWLVGLSPFGSPRGLTEHTLIAQVFSHLLLRKGVFLFFFCILLLGRKIMGQVVEPGDKLNGGFGQRLAAGLLGGACTLLLLSVLLTALAPFFPLFLGFLAYDMADSLLVEYLMTLGLGISPGL